MEETSEVAVPWADTITASNVLTDAPTHCGSIAKCAGDADVVVLRERAALGETYASLARQFDISPQHARNLALNRKRAA